MSVIRFIGKILKWSVISLFGIFVCAVVALMIFGPNCDGDSPKANYARSIPKERLELLFNQLMDFKKAEELRQKRMDERNGLDFSGAYIESPYERSPQFLKDLEFKNLRVSERSSRLMLQGCFDHFLTLNVEGLYGVDKPKIVLSWGEFTVGRELLWEK